MNLTEDLKLLLAGLEGVGFLGLVFGVVLEGFSMLQRCQAWS